MAEDQTGRIVITTDMINISVEKRENALNKGCANLFDVALAISRDGPVERAKLIQAGEFLMTGSAQASFYHGAFEGDITPPGHPKHDWHDKYQALVDGWMAQEENQRGLDPLVRDLRNPQAAVFRRLLEIVRSENQTH